jgi:hypothetical protein
MPVCGESGRTPARMPGHRIGSVRLGCALSPTDDQRMVVETGSEDVSARSMGARALQWAALFIVVIGAVGCASARVGEDNGNVEGVDYVIITENQLAPFDTWIEFPLGIRIMQRANFPTYEYLSILMPMSPSEVLQLVDQDLTDAGFGPGPRQDVELFNPRPGEGVGAYLKNDNLEVTVVATDDSFGCWAHFRLYRRE